MKKYIILFAFLTFGFISLGQRTFTQTTFAEMLAEYKRDSKAFFINRLSEDFRYTSPQGKFLYKKDVAGGNPEKIVSTLQAIENMLQNSLSNEILEPLVYQSRDLAIVSGRHKTAQVGSDGKETTGEVACTYAFQNKKGKWMFVASQQTSLPK